MKKLYFILFVLFIGTSVYSQERDKTAVSEVIETIYDKTTSVPAEHVYKVLVHQQKVTSISYLILYIIIILLAFAFYKYVKWALKEDDRGRTRYDESNGGEQIFTTLCALVVLVGLVFFFATIDITITGLINPEYGAIKEIMSLF